MYRLETLRLGAIFHPALRRRILGEIFFMSEKIKQFIAENMDKCICEQTEDSGTIIGLPYPYTVPTTAGAFRELYYWDTYFINVGLLLTKQYKQARNNIDDMLYLVHKYGFMPNGSRTFYLDRSQPPFLSMMVRDYYEATGEKVWLADAYDALTKEHHYWMTNRICENGLNHYGYRMQDQDNIVNYSRDYRGRTQNQFPEISDVDLSSNFIAQAESGWDFNPRFDSMAHHYAAADLNSLLWALENNMAHFAGVLENGEQSKWKTLADERRNKCNSFLWNEEKGAYLDRDATTGRWSRVFSAASFYPLMVGMTSTEKAAKTFAHLSEIEFGHGISSTEKQTVVPGSYQWAFPNGWPCLQYVVAKGLKNYGYHQDALRVAKKYVSMVDRVFDETGNLWEKYNVEDGSIRVNNEYEMPAMMGWTAGVYLYLEQELAEANK